MKHIKTDSILRLDGRSFAPGKEFTVTDEEYEMLKKYKHITLIADARIQNVDDPIPTIDAEPDEIGIGASDLSPKAAAEIEAGFKELEALEQAAGAQNPIPPKANTLDGISGDTSEEQMNALKAEATSLGVEFHPNISFTKLYDRVQEAKK